MNQEGDITTIVSCIGSDFAIVQVHNQSGVVKEQDTTAVVCQDTKFIKNITLPHKVADTKARCRSLRRFSRVSHLISLLFGSPVKKVVIRPIASLQSMFNLESGPDAHASPRYRLVVKLLVPIGIHHEHNLKLDIARDCREQESRSWKFRLGSLTVDLSS